MDRTEKRVAVRNLQKLVRKMVKCGVTDREKWRKWISHKTRKKMIARLFDYHPGENWPEITTLFMPDFDPTENVVLFNYTPVAHNVCHHYDGAWTSVLRMCRGIRFNLDKTASIDALPFEKFFNYGEHPETRLENLPEKGQATNKMDGHKFTVSRRKNGRFFGSTRGSFSSKTTLLAGPILEKHALENNWAQKYPKDLTLETEFIHPETRVHLDYDFIGFVIIGAFNKRTFEDLSHEKLCRLGKRLNLPVVEIYDLTTNEVIKSINDISNKGREGFVDCFPDGRRVKFKFRWYLGLMRTEKLKNVAYLLKKMMQGTIDDILGTLDDETKKEVVGKMNLFTSKACDLAGDGSLSFRQRNKQMYELLTSIGQNSSGNQEACRRFLEFIAKSS